MPDIARVMQRLRRDRFSPTTVLAVVLAMLIGGLLLYAFGTTRTGREAVADIPKAATLAPPAIEPVRNLDVDMATARDINARRPFVAKPVVAARPFVFSNDATQQSRAIACLAAAAWYEAGDDAEGQYSVVQTVLNRVRHPAFPASVCGVVFQGAERATGCQFSFTCDGAMRRIPSAGAWARATTLAAAMLDGKTFGAVGWATHYHTDWVVPYWSPNLAKLAKVKTHIFYVWPGYWGRPSAFTQAPAVSEPVVAALAGLSPAHVPIAGTGEGPVAIGPEPAPAALPDTPPVDLPSVSQRSLGKNVVRAHRPDSESFFAELDPAAFPGSYAIAALAVCKGKARCRFYGWREPARMARSYPLDQGHRAALSFVYTRDAQGVDRALWNCAQFDRANKAQCLPADGMLPD